MASLPNLRLTPERDPNRTGDPLEQLPLVGLFAVVFGFLGIFTIGYVFVPLAFICSVLAMFLGQGIWGLMGILLSVAGFFSSPMLLGLVGLTSLYLFYWPF